MKYEYSQIAKDNIDKLPKCLAPFVSLFHSSHVTSPCCITVHSEEGKTKGRNPHEYINSQFLMDLRKHFLNDDFDSLNVTCKSCLSDEIYRNIREEYLLPGHESVIENYLKYKDQFREDGYIDKFPLTRLTLAISNKCNGACRMCEPRVSSHRLEILEEARIIDLTKETEGNPNFKGTEVSVPLEHSLELIRRYSDTLSDVVLHGGDPTQATDFPVILDELLKNKDKIRLTLLSNGTFDRLQDGRLLWEALKPFHKLEIAFSLDGIPEVSDYIRIGTKAKRIVKLATECKKYFKDNPDVIVKIHSTITNHGICYLPEFLDWVENKFFPLGIVMTFTCVDWPVHYAPHNLPPKIFQAALKKLQEYKTDNEFFKKVIIDAENALFRKPFNHFDWYTCLWMDKKQDEITGLTFPLFEQYKESIIEVSNWTSQDSINLHTNALKDERS